MNPWARGSTRPLTICSAPSGGAAFGYATVQSARGICAAKSHLPGLLLSRRSCLQSKPPLADIKSRWAALVVSGIVKLPDKSRMVAIAKRDERRCKKQYNLKPNPLTVDFLRFKSGVAHEMGIRPNLVKIVFTDPKLWWHLFMGPINGPGWRLVGPGAKPEWARDVIVRGPTSEFAPLWALIQVTFTSWYILGYKVLGLRSAKKYRPSTLFQEN